MNNLQNIQDTALKLHGIFNSLKSYALTFEGEAEGEMQAFIGDAFNLCLIGYGLTNEIWKDAQDVNPVSVPLSVQISNVLNHPELPKEVSERLQDAMMNAFNDVPDKSDIVKYEKSPENIERILRGFK